MAALLASLRNHFLGKPEARVVLVGLDGSGKTTILHRLKHGKVVESEIVPTVGRHATRTCTSHHISHASRTHTIDRKATRRIHVVLARRSGPTSCRSESASRGADRVASTRAMCILLHTLARGKERVEEHLT